MSQGNFGNLCDTDNFGDPVVLYDTFNDRWVITDFAFQLDGAGNVVNPPGSFQCFAVSRSGDPLNGGWSFYSLHISDALQDYPKFGIWPDGLYMSANMFGFGANDGFQNVRVWALNLAQMEAGAATAPSVAFNLPSVSGGGTVFTALPSNARVQTGTPPNGAPNYLASVWDLANRVRIWKFHVDWTNTASSSVTGPSDSTVGTSWSDPPARVSSKSGNTLDTLGIRLMAQNEYTKIGGVESLWNSHTVQGSSPGQSAVRYYQVKVTGGTVETNATQGATWNPDSSNRFMPSAAVDREGDMALGYSVSSSTLFPAVRYAGRLAADPLNTLSQTENSFIDGTGTQTGSCGGTCHRWGDYSAMTLDPDGCTFWYSNEYYAASGLDFHTRIGSFRFPSCTPKANQTIVFATPSTRAVGDADFDPGATASSGLAVTYRASGSCTGSGTTVHVVGVGACTITASQAGNATFNPAGEVTRTMTTVKGSQSIVFGPLPARTWGDADFTVSASATSGLAVSTGAAGSCTIAGAVVHITGAGSCTITVSQAGDASFNPAPAVAQTFAIAKGAQTITFGPLARKTLGDQDFAVTATASSGLPVAFAASGACVVSGSTVHLKAAGSCTVTASQAGDAHYEAAAAVLQAFAIVLPPCLVPKVVGKTLAAAKAGLAKRGCRSGKVGRAYSRKVKKGRVVSQSVRAGRKVAARTKVNVVLSRGPKR
jgi:hypothetical protein